MTKSRAERKAQQHGDLERLLADFNAKGGKVTSVKAGWAEGRYREEGKVEKIEQINNGDGSIRETRITVHLPGRDVTTQMTVKKQFLAGIEEGKSYMFVFSVNRSNLNQVSYRVLKMPLPVYNGTNPLDPSRAPSPST